MDRRIFFWQVLKGRNYKGWKYLSEMKKFFYGAVWPPVDLKALEGAIKYKWNEIKLNEKGSVNRVRKYSECSGRVWNERGQGWKMWELWCQNQRFRPLWPTHPFLVPFKYFFRLALFLYYLTYIFFFFLLSSFSV